MRKIVEIYDLQGKAKTKKDAVNNALATIQSTVMQQHPESLILKIEPQDIEIIETDYQQKVERFLFLKKVKEIFDCRIKLKVEITIVEIS